ncbi:uncharacterized protein LOC17891438 isoform X1 [Capsella rubella]|uniref:uncharacterized protein LOC17891438 isoform X1 n=1 Tax=Capsella rubella TaxID=81985 RepID=UPI000CD52571|nr:uncharacterized protein LOC17891438 isoform X1 [Capsella rubella]
MDKEEVSPPRQQNGKKMKKKKVSPPPRLRRKDRKNMDKEEVVPHDLFHGLTRQLSEPPPLPKENPRCPVSHPDRPHTLCPRLGGNTDSGCFSCGEKTSPLIEDHNYHFFCQTCDEEFHRVCHMFPRNLTHPYHLQHPLTFTFRNYETGCVADGNIDESFCATVLSGSNMSHPKKLGSIEPDQCTWCRKIIQCNWFYRCSLCNFCLDLHCSQNIPPLLVANPKNHQHQLVFYRRPLLTPCDACGLVNVLDPSYACFECNYMIHQSCIELPRVIKITRHQHRLFHTPCLQSKISPCRICYETVDTKYGQYSCNHEKCSYIVHSNCATNENVWDGKELEQEPEEQDEIEDILPYKKVWGNLIKHFSHEHLLKLKKYDGVIDVEKQCQACILPIDSRDFYNCTHCAFFLHEVCANLLRKMSHALHKHPLSLATSPQNRYDLINCSACSRKSTGFRYICTKKNCVSKHVQIDVRCISSVPDYFTHESHEHPLFISTSSKGGNKTGCVGCKKIGMRSYLQCTKCKFAMCYLCATIPTKVSYKYDKHPLYLSYGEKSDDTYWCEVCEKKVNPRDRFYKCNECCITIHLHCIFGSSAYMKPGFRFKYNSSKVEVRRNSNITRPYCVECGHRCPGYIYYKNDNSVTSSYTVQILKREREMDWDSVAAEDVIEALREVEWSTRPRSLAEFFSRFAFPRSFSKWMSRLKCNLYYYRTNYFILLIFVLGLALITRPLAILGAALTALSLAFLNDSFAATFNEKMIRTIRHFSPHLAAKMRPPHMPVIRGRSASRKAVYVCGQPRLVFVLIGLTASFVLWFMSCGLLWVLYAFTTALLLILLHASLRTPNLKARLNTFREEFRAVWRNYSEL